MGWLGIWMTGVGLMALLTGVMGLLSFATDTDRRFVRMGAVFTGLGIAVGYAFVLIDNASGSPSAFVGLAVTAQLLAALVVARFSTVSAYSSLERQLQQARLARQAEQAMRMRHAEAVVRDRRPMAPETTLDEVREHAARRLQVIEGARAPREAMGASL